LSFSPILSAIDRFCFFIDYLRLVSPFHCLAIGGNSCCVSCIDLRTASALQCVWFRIRSRPWMYHPSFWQARRDMSDDPKPSAFLNEYERLRKSLWCQFAVLASRPNRQCFE
jgi:hypothetical protein